MSPPPPDGIAPEKARKNADAIRKAWRDGGKSLKRLDQLRETDPDAFTYKHKQQTLDQEAARLNININTAAKMRRVAEQYTAAQIEVICALVEKHRSQFGPTNLMNLLSVDDRDDRDRIMTEAIKESWSTSKLLIAIQAKGGKRRSSAGRKPQIPNDPAERLLTLDGHGERWLRFASEARSDLPDDIQAPLAKAIKALRKVHIAIHEEIQKASAAKKRQ
jgi:hypothetical protein